MIEREFPVAGGAASCTVLVRVMPDDVTAGADQEARLREARAFLAENDWSTLEATTIDSIPTAELAGKRRQGVSDELILTMHVSDQVFIALDTAGHMGEGVRLEQASRCSPEQL
ncbi:hypothetical protein [Marisediminicola sp. LYQ134]|uniref:hypothetical protein n=1 Tax=Marisediminicola sp. LYQ134 TaxID=3391061 RepID=UPI003982F029